MSDEYLDCDVLLIGGGIMSATVGVLLKELEPGLRIEIFERLDRVAAESTDARNNAGTGHAALCELNYTPMQPDGTIDPKKALGVMSSFEVGKQLWGSLVERGVLGRANAFIRSVPHISFVTGERDVAFLKERQRVLTGYPLFGGMQFSDARGQLQEWMPLVMAGRDAGERAAATHSSLGTDVDFGQLTRALFEHLRKGFGIEPWLEHEVTSVERTKDGRWLAEIDDLHLDIERKVRAKFVFIGAGGGALDLLADSEISEGDGYGGFPVSGLWLMCKNPDVVAKHHAKVYGQAKVGAPPMSVPHLDSRVIEGQRELLFGPFAGFSTKFLKEGSYFDLPTSLNPANLLPMISAGLRNLKLTQYLIDEVSKSFEDRIESLREFVPEANAADWALAVAGQRVQVIKKDPDGGGKLEFGTEIISAKDNTLAALLGASPGASTSVGIAVDLLIDCFPEKMETQAWQQKLKALIPSFGSKLASDEALSKRVRSQSHAQLGLES